MATSCRKHLGEGLGVLVADVLRGRLVDALGLLDAQPVLQVERVGAGRDVAVDQDDLGQEALVVGVEPVDHVGRPEVGGLRLEDQVLVAVALVLHVRPSGRLHELRGLVTLEHVAEVRREREVDVEEVRHVDDVVDDLAAVRVVDLDDVPGPVGVLVGADSGELGRKRVHVGGAALGVVPDQELVVAHDGSRSAAYERAAERAWRTESPCTCRRHPSASRGTGRRSRHP